MIALVAGLTAIGGAHAAPVTRENGSRTVAFDPRSIDSLAGAVLAAQTSEADRDYRNARVFYRRALFFAPKDTGIQRHLMIACFMSGAFDEGVRIANELKHDSDIRNIATLARVLDAIKERRFVDAGHILNPEDKKYEGLDRVMNGLLLAWVKLGAGRGREALRYVESLQGPRWLDIFQSYNAGMIAMAQGDKAAARRYLTDIITNPAGAATAPGTLVRAIMALAGFEAGNGRIRQALDAISAGEALVGDYDPFRNLRRTIESGGKIDPAAEDAVQGAAGVLFSLGSALNREGAEDSAVLYLQMSLAMDPENAHTLLALGDIAKAGQRAEQAIGYYREIPETSPMRRISALRLGLALAEDGRPDEARKRLQSLIDSDPDDMDGYLALGGVLSSIEDYRAMAHTYDEAVKHVRSGARKSDWLVFFERGIAYERLKEWARAEPNFKKALEINPNQPSVLNYLGYSWIDRNINLDEGLALIRRAVDMMPDDGHVVDSLGWAYFRLGRFDLAVKELERAVELKAGDPALNDHLGDAYWRVGRRLEAVYQWKRALRFEPGKDDNAKIKAKIETGLPPVGAPPLRKRNPG